MDTRRRIARGQWALLGLTALFLCLLLGLFFRDRAAAAGRASVETGLTVPLEEFSPDPSPLNVNAATEEELTALPGIGETLARRIVEYREEHGPFGSLEELTNVPGVGPVKLAALEGLASVEDTES